MALWRSCLTLVCIHSQPSHRKATSGTTTLRRLNARRTRQAVQAGQYSKAIQALASSGLAPPSPNVLQEMLTKHPQAPPPSLPSDPVLPPMDLSESIVSRCVRSFPSGSAPGPSGFRASHLREAVLCPSPSLASQTISILTKFCQLLAKGRTPPFVIPHLCGASLLACHKNGGLRPIAVGEVLRRLTSKCLSFAARSAADIWSASKIYRRA